MTMPNNPDTRSQRICVSIAASEPDQALKIAQDNEAYGDVIEIRLDSLKNPEPAPFSKGLSKPVLFTCRPTWEGGEFAGEEEARFAILTKAIESGASYVDVELEADVERRKELLTTARKHRVKSIVSWHNFDRTGSEPALAAIVQRMFQSGADIGKIVTTAHDFKDVLRVLALQELAQEMGFDLIAFCMGKPGVISRVATLAMNGYMSYCAPAGGEVTAPGQLPAPALQTIMKALNHAD